MNSEWMLFLVIAAIAVSSVIIMRRISAVEEVVKKRNQPRKRKEVDMSGYITRDAAGSYMNIVMILSVAKALLGDHVYYDEKTNRIVAAIDGEIISIFDISPELNEAARDVFFGYKDNINQVVVDVNKATEEAIRRAKW